MRTNRPRWKLEETVWAADCDSQVTVVSDFQTLGHWPLVLALEGGDQQVLAELETVDWVQMCERLLLGPQCCCHEAVPQWWILQDQLWSSLLL